MGHVKLTVIRGGLNFQFHLKVLRLLYFSNEISRRSILINLITEKFNLSYFTLGFVLRVSWINI